MKKTLVAIIFLSLIRLHSHAQGKLFNNVYDVNANTDFLHPNYVIGLRDHSSMAVSWGYDQPSWPRLDYFIVTWLDADGNPVMNNHYLPVSSPSDGFTHVKSLFNNDDFGNFAIGYYYLEAKSYIRWPFLMKMDISGNYQWTKIYQASDVPFSGWERNKISFCRVLDDPDETYFIVSCGVSDLDYANSVTTVIKVDAAGNMLWTKKYYNTNPNDKEYISTREIPSDISFSHSEKIYMITGTKQMVRGEDVADDNKLFFLGIDKDGNVATLYKSLTVQGEPYEPDMIYDPFTKNWVVTFTHKNTDYSGDQGVNSGIGLLTLNTTNQNINFNLKKFYWNENSSENFGVSVSVAGNGDYVLGSHTKDMALPFNNVPHFLRTDNSGVPLLNKRYSVSDNVIFGHHTMTSKPLLGSEEYVLVGLNEQYNDLKAIRTDIDGNACDYIDYNIKVKESNIEEKEYYYEAKAHHFDVPDYTPNIVVQDIGPKGCELGRPALANGISSKTDADGAVTIYPNVLTKTDALKIKNDYNSTLYYNIYDVTGKVVLTPQELKPGVNSLPAECALNKGLYFIRFTDAKNKVVAGHRIVVME